MAKRIPAKVNRYMKVMRALRDAKDTANSSTGKWKCVEPWGRDEASELQKHIHDMIRAKRAELAELELAWCEFIEMVDDGCVEEYTEFTRARMASQAEAMRRGHEELKKRVLS